MKTIVSLILTLCFFISAACSTTTEPLAIPELKIRTAGLGGKDFERQQRLYNELRSKFERDTNDLTSLAKIAQLFILEARATGEEHYYYSSATMVLDHILMRNPDHFEALVTKGTILLNYHRFDEALAVAERAQTVSKGGSAFVLGLLIDANVELGNYADAVRYSDAMLALRPDLRSYSRASYLRELHGDTEGAKQAMRMAAESGAFGEEDRAWSFCQLAKLYQHAGAVDTAAYIFNGILEERPSYVPALIGKAEVFSSQDKHSAAIAEVTKAMQLTKTHEVIEAAAGIYTAAGDEAKALQMQQEVEAMFRLQERDGWNVDREFAEFFLSHNVNSGEALERAERDFRRRPNNIHSQEIYAWALAVNGRAKEALPLIESALRLGMKDSGMFENAVYIYRLAGMNDKAQILLNKY